MNAAARQFGAGLGAAIAPAVIGTESVLRACAIALLAQGHLLLEGPPGLGKTRLARALATALGVSFGRVQGTSDLQPADITGVNVLDAARAEFTFRPGPLFADVLLFDEINRAGPRTQSALLEAMEERQVSVDGVTRALAPDFLVIATRNPLEFAGTFELPESQLDRFMLCVPVPYPDRAQELAVLAAAGPRFSGIDASVSPLPAGALAAARAALAAVHVAPAVDAYVLDLVAATRADSRLTLGVSTRGALALRAAARASAALRAAEFVTPDDVKAVAPWSLAHRILVAPEAAIDGVGSLDVVHELLERTIVPR
jgi:MoxR-like ATPase